MEDKIKDPRTEGIQGLKGINMQNEDSFLSSFANMKIPKYGELSKLTRPLYDTINPIEYVGTEDFGDSRYDKRITTLGELKDLSETRANIQPWYDKIAAGILKGTVLAGTTFADGIAGTIVGALNVVGNIDTIGNSDDPLRELGNQFINNPVSTYLAKINETMEEVLPNYYSKEELEAPWTENIFTANFIGDKFLKNLGFTIGAAYNARVTAGALAKSMGLKGVRDAFKGTVTTASGRVLNTSDEIAKAYKTGDAFIDGVKLTEDLGKAAKKLKNAEWQLKIIGAVNSAMGEGRIEAINNSKQWFDYNSKLLEDYKKKQVDAIEQELFLEHPEWFSIEKVGDKYKSVLTSKEGLSEWEKRKQEIEDNHKLGLEKLSKDRANMANAVFGANVALLSASNLWRYGRFISGGFTSGRQAKNLVKGTAKTGFEANKNIVRQQYLRALSNPFVEMNEEMSQAFASESAGLKYTSELNNFFGAKINPEAEEETAGWLDSIIQGAANTYGNFDRWEEGFLGFLTGALGIPKISFNRNTEGKRRPSISLEGELWQGLKDAKDLSKEATNVTDALNKRIQSEEFLNYYQGAIRHNKYQNDMEAALDRGNDFDYKNAEHSQFVSDAILFDKAGRIQDLYDIIEEANNITLEDANDIRAMITDKSSGKSLFEGKTDEEVINHVKKQAEETKNKLDSYVKISNDLKTLYGDNISSNHLEELTWMMSQVDDWENRTKSIINELQSTISDKAAILNSKFGIDVNSTLGNLEWTINHMTDDNNIIDEINSIIEDKNISVEEGRLRIETLIKAKELERRNANLSLGRQINKIRRDFKNSRDRLEKQRQKLLKQINVAEADKAEFQANTSEYKKKVEDNENAQIALIKETRNKIEKIKDTIFKPKYKSQKHSRRLEKREQTLFDTANELGGYIEELDNMLANKEINYARLSDIMNTLETKIFAIEGKFMSNTLFDARTKLGYIPGSQEMTRPKVDKEGNIVRDENGNIVYESVLNTENELRLRHKEEDSNLLSQIVALKELLTNDEYKILDPINTRKASESLIDLIKLYTARNKFISKYSQLADNPELFTEEAQREIENITANIENKEVQRISNENANINSLKDLKNNLREVNPNIRAKVLENLKASENEKIKTIAEEYDKLEEASTLISDIINSKQKTPEVISATNIISDALNNAESLQEALQIIADGLAQVDESISNEILSIMDSYTEHVESKKSTKKDKKKAKKKLKKKSALDAVEEEQPAEDEDEGSLGILDKAGKDNDEPDGLQQEEKRPKRKATKDESIKAASKEELEEVVRGEATLQGVEKGTKEEKVVKELAERELKRRKSPLIHSEDGESAEGNSETNIVKKEDTVSSYLRSWAVTQFNFNDLKNRDTRRAVPYNDPRVSKLIELGAFDFVDKGHLGDLYNKNNDIPIHYIAVSSGPLNNTILLAIEVTEDVVPINAITAQDGKQYQVVGTLGFNKDNSKSTKAYNDIVDYISDEKEGSTSKYFVSSMTNKIRHIYSGRMVKSTEDETVRQRTLKEVLNGEKPHFGIYYKNGDFRTPTLGEDVYIVPLNDNNNNPREGSIWLMTKEADGRYYAKSLKIARFNSSYDLEGNLDSPIIKRIIDDIREIVDPTKSDYDRSIAKYDLEEILYFPEGNTILFNKVNDNEVAVSIEGFENNIGEGLELEEQVNAILNALQSDELDLRFQVSPSKLTDSDYVEDLLNSDILSTDIFQTNNVNASFDMYLPNFETGEPVIDKESTRGHTGRKGINNTIAGETIIHNGNTYKLTNEGVFKGDEQITDQNIIDEIKFISKIKAGTINPVEGNSKLYLGAYSNGERFGVINYKVKTGEELEKLLDKARKNLKKVSAEEFMNSMAKVEEGESVIDYDPFESVEEESNDFGLQFEAVTDEESDLPYEVENKNKKTRKAKENVVEKAEKRRIKEEIIEEKGPSLSDTFNPTATKSAEELAQSTESFDSLVRTNVSVVRELGFKSVSEFKNYISNPDNNLPDIDTINTKQAFDSLVETIKNCR